MNKNRSCGNCKNFIRIKTWGGYRNGICDAFDYNCTSDSSYAKYCNAFNKNKYNRVKPLILSFKE